jgi:hypothetical protein
MLSETSGPTRATRCNTPEDFHQVVLYSHFKQSIVWLDEALGYKAEGVGFDSR